VLVHALPEQKETLKLQLEKEDGVEVHSMTDDGRLVVTVEKNTQEETGDTLNRLQKLDHIISTSIVYQYFDSEIVEQEVSS